MGTLDTMDLQVAIIAHLNWKSRLSDFFYGMEDLNASDVPDHVACDFGKWLYGSGLQDFSGFQEIKRVETLHKEVHAAIKIMLAMSKEQRMTDTGKQALANFKQKCDRLVNLMEAMEAYAERK